MALIVYNITGSPVTLVGVPLTIPASSNPPERGEGFNVTSELKGLTFQQYSALEAQRPGKLEYHWSGEPEFDVSVLTIVVPGGDLPDIPTDNQKAALVGTSGVASGTNRYVTNQDPRLVASLYLPNANEKAALQGSYSVANAVNPYVTSDDPRVPTQDENDALAGTSGPPNQWNPFVTSFDPRLENARVPLAHRGTHEQGQPDAILSLPTNSQKAALVGTDGTPAAGNPFVTNSDPRNTNARIPTAHAGSHMGGLDAISTLPTAAQKSALSGTGEPGILNPYVTDDDPRLNSPLLPTEDQKAALAGADGKTPNAGNPYVTSYDSHLPTTGEKAGLAGTRGVPGAGNPYVTKEDADNRAPNRHASSHGPTGSDPVAVAAHASAHMGGADAIGTLPTSDQKAALAGTDGSPSGTNKLVTNSDPRNSDARAPINHASGHEQGEVDAIASLPTDDQKAALAGADGKTPNAGNPYVTSMDSHLPSTDEKSALAGTDGTPSNTNRLVTNSDSRNSNSRTPTGTAGGSLSGTYPNPGVANGVLAPANDAVADASGLSGLQVLRKSFVAGAGGSADDVAIYTADAPFAFRVLDALLYVSTAVLTATVTLRDTAAGGGNALSDGLDAATTGCKRNVSLVATGAVAVGGSLVLRRSDSGVAGEVVLYLRKE